MLRVLVIFFVLLTVGCTTLDSDSNFDDAIAAVNTKSNYKQVVAKPLLPGSKTVQGSNLVDAKLTLVGNYSDSGQKVPESYIKLDITTFKSYSEYTTVRYKGDEVKVRPYAPSSDTCSDHCTTTYYLTIPVSNSLLISVEDEGLSFELANANNSSVFSFNVPRGYVDAVTDQFGKNTEKVLTTAEPVKASKPTQMVEYWYQEATAESQTRFTEWAFENRTATSQSFNAQNKAEEMMSYWFQKATTEERKQILSWLVVQ